MQEEAAEAGRVNDNQQRGNSSDADRQFLDGAEVANERGNRGVFEIIKKLEDGS